MPTSYNAIPTKLYRIVIQYIITMPTSYNAIPTKLYHIVIQYHAINHANPNILHCNTKQTQYHVMYYTIANILLCNTKLTIQCKMQSIYCTNAIMQRTLLKCNGMLRCQAVAEKAP